MGKWKQYEIFKVLKVQKRIVPAITILGNTVFQNGLPVNILVRSNIGVSRKNAGA